MKTTVATLLCVCYVAVLLRPVAPMLVDVMAHMFWESEHIATVHYENGNYHVHVEVNEAAKDSKENQPQSNSVVPEIPVHFLNQEIIIDIPLGEKVRLVEHTRHCKVRDGYFSVPAPPPWNDSKI